MDPNIMVHPHALKHGLSVQEVTYAWLSLSKCIRRESADEPPRWLGIGWLTDGTDVELIGIETVDGWLVIHAKAHVEPKFAAEIQKIEKRAK